MDVYRVGLDKLTTNQLNLERLALETFHETFYETFLFTQIREFVKIFDTKYENVCTQMIYFSNVSRSASEEGPTSLILSFFLNTKMVLRHNNMLHCCLLTIDNNISAFMRQIRIQKSDKTIAKQPEQSGKMTDKRKNVENREPKKSEAKWNREKEREEYLIAIHITIWWQITMCPHLLRTSARSTAVCVCVWRQFPTSICATTYVCHQSN